MRVARVLRVSLVLFAMGLPVLAQAAPIDRVPPGVDALGAGASRTVVAFDSNMLALADQLVADRPAAFHGITVNNYRFHDFASYDAGTMAAVAEEYHRAGWKHLVSKSQRDTDGNGTDLWMHFRGADIDSLAVLVRTDKNMSFVSISCDLKPLDLLHLSGHFGIPKVDPNAVMVPAPDGK